MPAVESPALEPASGAVARPEPPPAVAPVPRTELERALSSTREGSSAARALTALVGLWGYQASFGGEVEPRQFEALLSGFSSLRVFIAERSTYQLWRTNLPAILELEIPAAGKRFVTLTGLPVRGPARLAVGQKTFELERADLERLWTGRTVYLWTNFEAVATLDSGMDGGGVEWLQGRLMQLGYLRKHSASGEFDASTRDAVRGFQTAYALEESGQVGPETLIALYQALRYGAPHLASRSEGS